MHAIVNPPTAPLGRLARIDVNQYHRMIETGILREGVPIELIDGLLVHKDRSARGGDPMSIGPYHNMVIKLLAELDADVRTFGMHLQCQSSISIPPHSEPEPDGVILKGSPRDYRRLAEPADITCVIEVSDSSLDYDRTTKRILYAKAAIPQYVIINLIDRQLEVYTQPENADYAETVILHDGEVGLALCGGQVLKVPVTRLQP